jgi:hypothetical protein
MVDPFVGRDGAAGESGSSRIPNNSHADDTGRTKKRRRGTIHNLGER